MQERSILSIIYTLFVGLLMAFFVGFGINTFYAPPSSPQYPAILNGGQKEATNEQIAAQIKFDNQIKNYQMLMRPYNRNVSIITLIAAVVLLVISLIYENRIRFISDGVILGGLFTLVYSLIRSFASGDSRYIFMVISISLIVVLVMGYRQFVTSHVSYKPKVSH